MCGELVPPVPVDHQRPCREVGEARPFQCACSYLRHPPGRLRDSLYLKEILPKGQDGAYPRFSPFCTVSRHTRSIPALCRGQRVQHVMLQTSMFQKISCIKCKF